VSVEVIVGFASFLVLLVTWAIVPNHGEKHEEAIRSAAAQA